MSKYFGQRETDRIIESYFPNQCTGFCIEVGAYDGIKGSNTKYFEDLGWETLCIEPNPYVYPELIKNRKGRCIQAACDNYIDYADLEIFDFQSGIQSSLTSLQTDPRLIRDYADAIQKRHHVTVLIKTLDSILANVYTDRIDFVSIDTEGTELRVLQGFDLQVHKPKLLVVEENYEEDTQIKQYLQNLGYRFDQRFFVNNFYVRNI